MIAETSLSIAVGIVAGAGVLAVFYMLGTLLWGVFVTEMKFIFKPITAIVLGALITWGLSALANNVFEMEVSYKVLVALLAIAFIMASWINNCLVSDDRFYEATLRELRELLLKIDELKDEVQELRFETRNPEFSKKIFYEEKYRDKTNEDKG